jgi:ParB family chromosome partitioning protein
MAKKHGLGGNLDSIFDDLQDDSAGNLTVLKLSQIEPNKDQPRKSFDPEKLNLLADSIAEHGIIQPLTVRPVGDTYQIVTGERRWRAARIAGLTEVPVRIMELSDAQTMQVALIENLQREDLNPIEEAGGYQELIDRFGMKQDEIARKVGKARSSVANALRLLALPKEVREAVAQGELSRGHCKVLMGANDPEWMIALCRRVIAEGISVHTLEKLVKAGAQPPKSNPAPVLQEWGGGFASEAAVHLTNRLGKPVKITKGKKTITFAVTLGDEDELREFLRIFGE